MSDTYDLGDLSTANLDTSAPVNFNPGNFTLDTSNLSSIFGGASASGAPLVAPVLNLPTSGNTGLTGVLKDLTTLVTNVYQGEAQVEAAKSQTDIARAQSNLALANIKGAPTIWTILGIGAAGLFLLELVNSGKGK